MYRIQYDAIMWSNMQVCVDCVDMRIVDVLVEDLDCEMEKEIQKVVRNSFGRQNDVHMGFYKSVVMVQEKVTRRSGWGWPVFKWSPVAVMFVKTDDVMRDEFREASLCVNLTCVCVSHILRGQGIGTSMMRWFLDTLPAETVVYLHVDKVMVNVQVFNEGGGRGVMPGVLREVDQTEAGNEMQPVQHIGKAIISRNLVKWYETMGFKIRYENEVEVCLFQITGNKVGMEEFLSHVSEESMSDDMWESGTNDDTSDHIDMSD